MLISVNNNGEMNEFSDLLNQTIHVLNKQAKNSSNNVLQLTGNKLEPYVKDIMVENAKGTIFENTIELISGQRFPDIIAKKYFGVEVKSTTQNHWRTTGNSVLESTRVDGIEKIFLLFGKLVAPIEFRYKPYQDCLSEVVVTHSPRYLVDMNLVLGETIFDKIAIPYDELRKKEDPIKAFKNYYRSISKEGDDVWWIDQEISTSFLVKSWSNLAEEQRNSLVSEAMVLFPEIFGKNNKKFSQIAIWLATNKNIIHPNVRDSFTAGGKANIRTDIRTYMGLPKILVKLYEHIPDVKQIIKITDAAKLSQFWKVGVTNRNKTRHWVDQVISSVKETRFGNEPQVDLFISDIISKIAE